MSMDKYPGLESLSPQTDNSPMNYIVSRPNTKVPMYGYPNIGGGPN